MKSTYVYIIVGVLSFLLYANTITHEYAWDDQIVITQNNVTTKGVKGLVEIWTTKNYIQDRPTYRPIPQTLHALEWEFFPNNPMVGHLTAVLTYVLCVLSFLFVLKHFFPEINNWLILFIGAMFSLLPVHTEVVANIKSIDEVLSAFFIIWAIYFASKKGWKYFIVSIILFVAALLSKVSAITILPIVFVFWIYKSKRKLTAFNSFLAKNIEYVELFTLILFLSALLILYPDLYILGALLILIYGFKIKIKINFYSLLQLFTFILFAFLFELNHTVTFFLVLYWFYKLEDKKITLSNYPIFLIVLTITILQTTKLIDVAFYCFIFFVLFTISKVIESKKKPTWLWILVLINFILFILFYQEPTDLGFIEIVKFFTLIILFSSPIIYYYLVKNSNPKVLLFTFVSLSLIIFSTKFYNKIPLNLFEKNTPTQVVNKEIKDDFEKRIFLNQPYHNVLVASENIAQKSATICRVQLIYLQKLIFPVHLIHQHGTRQIEFATWKDWDVYLSIIIHLILIGGVYYFYKQKRYPIMFGIIWYFLSMSIYTNIVRLMPDTLAERFLFLPSFGFSVAFICGLFYAINKTLKNEAKTYKIMSVLLLPLFIYYGYKTIDRNKDWENNYTLAANTLPFASNNATINAQYALEVNNLIKYNLVENKDSAQALVLKHYQKAIDIFPDFYGPQSDLGLHYIFEAEPNKAFPYLVEATRIKPNEWILQYYVGLIYYERKKYNEAIERFNSVQTNKFKNKEPSVNPEFFQAYEYKARCLHNLGKDDLAAMELEKGIDLFNQKSSYVLLGNLYRTIGKKDKAIEVFERLLVQNPNDQELINTIQLLKEGKIY